MSLRPNDLHLHDSLSRKKLRFEPLEPGHVGIYVCGPTVYSDAHLGHAKTYVCFDVVVRYLRHLGYRVRYVQNITDVGHLTDDADEGEDKILKRARLDQLHPMELAETYTRSYQHDMEALKVVSPDIAPRATQHVPEQIAYIEDLIEKGHAYEAEGNVYFSVPSWKDYGELSGRRTEDSEDGFRVAVRTDKRDPRDFALWKAATGGHILRWQSPWGWGYPGWHIECSAMSTKYLGTEFDIHGGGLDNQFPHHECEIAQSRAVGMPFARYWLHNNMLKVEGQKMGKSLGNFTLISDALAAHDAETIRYFLLSTHYRSPSNYTADALQAARSGLDRLSGCVAALRERAAAATDQPGPGDPPLLAALDDADRDFHASMDDDLNTPLAIAALFECVRKVNAALAADAALSKDALDRALALFETLGEGVLGIVGTTDAQRGDVDYAPFVDLLLNVRTEMKSLKAYDLADLIRDRLAALGIEVKDTKDGAKWSADR